MIMRGLGGAGGTLLFKTVRTGLTPFPTTLYVGDQWVISILGASPNQPVVNRTDNFVDGVEANPSQSTVGSTDSVGNFFLTGTITPSDIGNWNEYWSVGGIDTGTCNFQVLPVIVSIPQAMAQTQTQTQTPTPTPTPSMPTPTPVVSTPVVASSFFQESVSVGGVSIPVWLIVAGVGVVVVMMNKGR